MKNLLTVRNDSSFAVQFSVSVSKTRAILLFKVKIKLIEMFELHEGMPGIMALEGMQSADTNVQCWPQDPYFPFSSLVPHFSEVWKSGKV